MGRGSLLTGGVGYSYNRETVGRKCTIDLAKIFKTRGFVENPAYVGRMMLG